ncbi:hypothetical protein DV515_00015316 [Chloebia gouldiae]|uniref:Uncharacterized protein n=1 Tax=Chloebia gouldiae TaxID=44316 RepID=A0A3L8RVQ4_CHLGU|nr:hypothetical protein DV515_00015316 [Chloebia gouldiae]
MIQSGNEGPQLGSLRVLQQVLKVLLYQSVQQRRWKEASVGFTLLISPVSLGMSQGPPALRWLQDRSNSRGIHVAESSANPELTRTH